MLTVNKINILTLLMVFLSFSNVHSNENNEACFETLLSEVEESKNLHTVNEIMDSLEYSNHLVPHSKYWDGAYFYNDRIYMKFYPLGSKSSFKYELSEIETNKFGSMDWNYSYEYMYFEQYFKDLDNSMKFNGCGLIRIEPRGNYTYSNIDNSLYWGSTNQDSNASFKDSDSYVYSYIRNPSLDINQNPFVLFEIHRILINNDSIGINYYDLSKNQVSLYERVGSEVTNEELSYLFGNKLLNTYSNFSKDFRIGLLPYDFYLNELEEIRYIPLRDSIKKMIFPSSIESIKNKELNSSLSNSYMIKTFSDLNKVEFRNMLIELHRIDKGFNISKFRSIENNCLSKYNFECIGDNLTKYLYTMSNGSHSVNYFVDLIMTNENNLHNLNSTYVDYIYNYSYDIYPIRDIENVDINEDITQQGEENRRFYGAMILITTFLCVVIIGLYLKRRRNLKFKGT